MPIPATDSVHLDHICSGWDTAERLLDPTHQAMFAQKFGDARELRSEAREDLAEDLRGWVPQCLRAIGLLERPAFPGLNEAEFGLLRIDDLLCRFLERLGPCGLRHADEVAALPYESASAHALTDINGYPAWLHRVADVIVTDSDEARCPGLHRGRLNLPARWEDFVYVSWPKWLLLTDKELEAVGVPRCFVAELRMEMTGHDRAMSLKWARSIGMWGRVKTLHDIARATGASLSQVTSYKVKRDARSNGKVPLQARDRNASRTQADLAFAIGCLGRTDQGVLRIEAKLYEDMYRRCAIRLEARETEETPKSLAAVSREASIRVEWPTERWGQLGDEGVDE